MVYNICMLHIYIFVNSYILLYINAFMQKSIEAKTGVRSSLILHHRLHVVPSGP